MKRCAILRGGPLDGQLLDVESTWHTINVRDGRGYVVYRYRGLTTTGLAEYHLDHAIGRYTCRGCFATYTVNDPGSWARCTPHLCHACTALADEFVRRLITPQR